MHGNGWLGLSFNLTTKQMSELYSRKREPLFSDPHPLLPPSDSPMQISLAHTHRLQKFYEVFNDEDFVEDGKDGCVTVAENGIIRTMTGQECEKAAHTVCEHRSTLIKMAIFTLLS